MSEDRPGQDDSAAGGSEGEPAWRVDAEESLARMRKPGHGAGGKVVYVDEQGQRRRLPADMAKLTPGERRAAASALSQALGAPDPDYARLAAVERLTELRAAGAVSEEKYERERRRLMGDG